MKKIWIIIGLVLMILVGIFIFVRRDKTNEEASNSAVEGNLLEKNEEDDNMNQTLQLEINGTHFTIALEQNETVSTLIQELPLEMTMNELNGNEKYYYLDHALPTNSTQVGTIEAGDVMLYGSDCLVIFYESFHTSYFYTKVGHIEDASQLKDVVGRGNVTVKITK